MKQPKGFTLIELMIVVTVMAILSAIAISRYTSYVERSRESAARSLLQGLVLAQSSLKTNVEENDFIPIHGPTAPASIYKLTSYGFRPDPQVGFAALSYIHGSGGAFIVFGASANVGARIFVFNFIPRAGVRPFEPTEDYAAVLPATMDVYEWRDGTVITTYTLNLDATTGRVTAVTRL